MSEIKNKDDYILLPNSESHNCFGCSPKNSSGLKMEFYANPTRDSVVSWLSVPGHLCGWANFVHGGIVSTILDEAMGWASLVLLPKLVLSKSISVEFLKPVFIDVRIRAEGSVFEVRNERDGTMQGYIYDDSDDVCAKATSVVSLFTLETIRKMGAMDEEILSGIEQVMNTIRKE